jgi:hypothetical protein
LAANFAELEDVVALVLGDSAATGLADEWSDYDLLCIYSRGSVDRLGTYDERSKNTRNGIANLPMASTYRRADYPFIWIRYKSSSPVTEAWLQGESGTKWVGGRGSHGTDFLRRNPDGLSDAGAGGLRSKDAPRFQSFTEKPTNPSLNIRSAVSKRLGRKEQPLH